MSYSQVTEGCFSITFRLSSTDCWADGAKEHTLCVLNVADTDYSFKAVIEVLWYAISSPSTSRQESLLSYIGAVSTLNAAPIIMQATEVYFKSLLLLQCI